jgi:hypothetical protein
LLIIAVNCQDGIGFNLNELSNLTAASSPLQGVSSWSYNPVVVPWEMSKLINDYSKLTPDAQLESTIVSPVTYLQVSVNVQSSDESSGSSKAMYITPMFALLVLLLMWAL